MVSRNSKSFIFSAFFSINLLISAVHAAEQAKAVAPYVGAAMVAGLLENRLVHGTWGLPVSLINQTRIDALDSKEELIDVTKQLPELAEGETQDDYAHRLNAWATQNQIELKYDRFSANEVEHLVSAFKKEKVSKVVSSSHCLGLQVGNIPLQVTVPGCETLKNSPWVRRLMQVLKTEVVIPGANLKNALEIVAVLKLGSVGQKHLPSISQVRRK